jgi:hypothetical protein
VCKSYQNKFTGDYKITSLPACQIQLGGRIQVNDGHPHQIKLDDVVVINQSLHRRADGSDSTYQGYFKSVNNRGYKRRIK